MLVKDLRDTLRKRGLPTSGRKAELLARLAEDSGDTADAPLNDATEVSGHNTAIDTTPATWMPATPRSWIVSMRPWSAPASLVPVVLAGALANRDLGTDLLTAPFFLCLGGVLALHFAANLTNTYFDYVRKVDTKESADDRALVDSKLAPRVVLGMAIACFAAAAASAAAIVAQTGSAVVSVAALALALGFFYTGGPCGCSLKKLGLGDATIFAMFGPLLMLGVFLAITSEGTSESSTSDGYDKARTNVLLYSVPMGVLASAILHSNNARDMAADAAAGIVTLAQCLGRKGSFVYYVLQLIVAYAVAVALLARDYPGEAWRIVPALCGVPWALFLVRCFRFDDGKGAVALRLTPALATISPRTRRAGLMQELPQRTAQHNLFFSTLLLLSITSPQLCARTLLGILFYLGGFNNLLMWSNSCALVQEKLSNICPFLGSGRCAAPLVPIAFGGAIVVQLVAAVCFILGYEPRLAAQVLLVWLIPVTLCVHDFWTIDDDSVATLRPTLPPSVAAAQRVNPTFPTEFDAGVCARVCVLSRLLSPHTLLTTPSLVFIEFVHFFKNVQIIGGLVCYLVFASEL